MRASENFTLSNQGAGSYPVVMGNVGGGVGSGTPLLEGGRYAFAASATFGGGSIELQMLGPDGVTFLPLLFPFNNAGTEADLDIGKLVANGMKVFDLPPGKYQVVITTATAAYVGLTRVPLE